MDEQGNAQSLGEAFSIMDRGHELVHLMSEEVDEGSPALTMALNEKEILLIVVALPALEVFYPCLHEDSLHLQARIIELAQFQQPEFKFFNYDDSGGEG